MNNKTDYRGQIIEQVRSDCFVWRAIGGPVSRYNSLKSAKLSIDESNKHYDQDLRTYVDHNHNKTK
jgi:hypothetical protein